ncbi:MAG: iron-containing alcohol dehydrogenase [Myxococcales bacterium]|nr:iron-containing alcohol dehydrogenase [Myxococcales bacterium]
MNFEFASAGRILFGVGRGIEAGAIAASLGRRALLVTGRAPRRFPAVIDAIADAGVEIVGWTVGGEPTVADALAGVARAREAGCDLVIGLGGGSAIDAGKAIAALLTNPGEPLDYLEVVGRGRPLSEDPAPFVAIPTTAGTGSEVTRNAVLAVPEARVKVSLRSPKMLPPVAIVDPGLTRSMPPALTADVGLDALTQVIEPYVCNQPSPITDALARDGIARAAGALRRAVADGDDLEARTEMALASLFGGLALANAKLGAVHGFAGPIGGMFPAPHGAVCARLLPPVVAANVAALRARRGDAAAASLDRYLEVARLLTGWPDATIDAGVAWLARLADELGIQRLAAYGVGEAEIPAIVAAARRSSSMRGNPVELSDDALASILRAAI